MAPKLHFPSGYALISMHFAGAAMPNGGTATFGCIVNPSTDTPSAIATRVKTELRAAGGPFVSSIGDHTASITLLDISCKFGPQDTGPEATVGDGQPLSGGSAQPHPPSLAYLVTKQTFSGGKRGKGRMFIPGLGEQYVDGAGNLDPGAVDRLNTRWKQFETNMDNAQHGLVVMHSYDVLKNQQPQLPSQVDTLNVSALAATQRQRMRR